MESTKEISDGHHTFGELYAHRHALFMALLVSHPEVSWWSRRHSDGGMYKNSIVAGMGLTGKQISYHFPDVYLRLLEDRNIKELDRAPKYDGHSAESTIDRLNSWSLRLGVFGGDADPSVRKSAERAAVAHLKHFGRKDTMLVFDVFGISKLPECTDPLTLKCLTAALESAVAEVGS